MLESKDRLEKKNGDQGEASQESQHLDFLRALGFAVETLQFGVMTKCCGLEEQKPSGSFAYITHINQLKAGLGLFTVATVRGKTHKHGTTPKGNGQFPPFFSGLSHPFVSQKSTTDLTNIRDDAAQRAKDFFNMCAEIGTSDYLKQKEVGSYRIRFKATGEYGKTAVIPMVDIDGKIWNHQMLNANSTKVFRKGARVEGLFHSLTELIDGQPIGISESYVTGASSYELSGIRTVCAFSASNLLSVAKSLREKYPLSKLVVWADNDRHLESNIGFIKATEVCKTVSNAFMVFPAFDDPEPRKDATDFNDLIRMQGRYQARNQILQQIKTLS